MSKINVSGADLSIVKTTDNPNAQPGANVGWTVVVTNNGNEVADNVVVYDTLPSGLTYIGNQTASGSYDVSSGEWKIGSLAPGQSATLNIQTTLNTIGSEQTNTAHVVSSTEDVDHSNNTDSASTQAQSADVRIEKQVSNHNPEIGEQVSWTVNVINDGPNAATTVKVMDILPEGLSHVGDEATVGDYDEHRGEWYIGNLASGARATLVIDTTVIDSGSMQTNSATVTTAVFDPNEDNNTAEASITATGSTADLHVDKVVSDTRPDVGEEVTWTVTITNEGPHTATNVNVCDTLPAGVTLVDSSITAGKFDEETLLWCIESLGSGQSQTLTLTTTVDEAGSHTNHVKADSDTFDPDSSDDADSATIHAGRADVSISKVVSEGAPAVGDSVTWTILVQNNGPHDASGVMVRDELPAGLKLIGEDATTNSYDEDRDMWWIGDLANGASQTLVLTTVVEDASQAITNQSTVVSRTVDTDTDNNVSSATTDAQSADLALTKTVSDETPNYGDEIVWTVEVTNLGPDTAVNTVVFDNLPAGVEYVANSVSNGTYNPDNGSWTLGDLASGATETLEITTQVLDTDIQMNIAVATSDTHDPDDCNNHDYAFTDADDAADLSVSKSVDQTAPNLGDEVIWTIVVSNDGPDTAENVVLSDTLPEGLTLVSQDSGTGELDADSGQWVIGDLASGQSVTLTLVTTVDSADAQINTGTVTSDTFDYDLDNNSDTAETDAVFANLAVEKTVSDDAPNLGDSVSWTIVASNLGDDTAVGVEVADTLPAGVTLTDASAEQGKFDEATGIWTIGELDSNTSVELVLTTTVDDAASVQTNAVTITSDTFDPDSDNNSDDASLDAVAADLSVVKSVDNEAPELGESVTWTIVAGNLGADPASGVEVADTLPAGVTLTDASAEQGEFDEATGIWTIGDLASNTSVELVLTTTVDDAASVQTNAVTITSDTFDPNSDNNSDDASVDAVAADLSVVKSVDNEAPELGESVTWTIVAGNLGADPASGVEVADTLPAGVTLTDASAEQGEFDAATGIWTIGDLASNSSVELVLTTTVDDASSVQTNAVTISSDTFDPNSDNNSDDASVDAVAADLSVVKSVDNDMPATGDTVNWTVTVANDGPDTATSVSISDALPAGVSLSDSSVTAGEFDAGTGIWTIAELPSGEQATLTLATLVEDVGVMTNTAQVASVDQVDPDSTPGNSDSSEDDQASASIEASASGPTASNNKYEVDVSGVETINAFIVVDRSDSMNDKVTLADGTIKTRIEITREAILDFAARDQITGVKIVAFDSDTVPQGKNGDIDEVTSWFDLTTASGQQALDTYVENLVTNTWTNYETAIEATMEYFDKNADGTPDTLLDADHTNMYFLSDGQPTQGGLPDTHLLSDAMVEDWHAFVEDNFSSATSIGFGGGIKKTDALEQVAHEPGTEGDDPTVEGDDPFALLLNDANELPSELLTTITESVSGNVITDDTGSGKDSPLPVDISALSIDSYIYSYDGTDILYDDIPLTATVEGSVLNIPTAAGGRLEFNFETGDFEYLSGNSVTTETFMYTIIDGEGQADNATVELHTVDPETAAGPVVAPQSGSIAALDVSEIMSVDDGLEWFVPGDSPLPGLLPAIGDQNFTASWLDADIAQALSL